MKAYKPGPEHAQLYTDLNDLLKQHCDKLPAHEILAIASNMVGKILAMQDQRTMTPDEGMRIIALNIEQGNAEAIAEILAASGRPN